MQSVEELTADLELRRRQLDELTAEVALNDDKMRRSQQRELRLLQATDLGSLLEEMIGGLRESYRLKYVSVVLCDPDHDIRHLLLASGTPAESFPRLVMVESLTGLAPQYVALCRPWLGDYATCDHQLIFPDTSGIATVAMIPLIFRGNLIGSINLGSDDAQRFTRDHASDFLAHLGIIGSFCIENGLNRARLLRSGFTDVLTGWHNRRYLQVRLKEELARACRDGSNLVCRMLDIDHFKQVNDTWGHAAGDAVLQELAQRVEAQVRASDVAARYGGEEFVILAPETDLDGGRVLAERIRRAIEELNISHPAIPTTDRVTVSIGVASGAARSWEGLLNEADAALYTAKKNGRNRVCAAKTTAGVTSSAR